MTNDAGAPVAPSAAKTTKKKPPPKAAVTPPGDPPSRPLVAPPPPRSNADLLQARRQKFRGRWFRWLQQQQPENEEAVLLPLARDLEVCVFNAAVRDVRRRQFLVHASNQAFWRVYDDRNRSLWRNLGADRALRTDLLAGTVRPSQLEQMHVTEFNPARWRRELELKAQRTASRVANKREANTSAYACETCQSRKCFYVSVQMRSADEQETLFIDCLDCGHRWTE